MGIETDRYAVHNSVQFRENISLMDKIRMSVGVDPHVAALVFNPPGDNFTASPLQRLTITTE
jgi:hypothetical protein